MQRACVGVLVAVTACWRGHAQEPIASPELDGILRVDDAGTAVLDRADGKQLRVASGTEPWSLFRDARVRVTGRCRASGELVIDTLRATDGAGRRPYLGAGPLRTLRGELTSVEAPPNSKLAGSSRVVFRGDDGESLEIVGDAEPTGTIVVRGRMLEPDMSYMARVAGPDLWIASRGPSSEVSASEAPVVPCD